MSYEPSGLSGHHVGELNRVHGGTRNSFNPNSIVNGGHTSRPNEAERKRNYKLLIDPVLKGRGHQKIYRFDGEFEGQASVIPKDPRSRRTRLWSTRTKADLPVPKFKIDKYYVGIPPQRDVILNGLNDNVDRKFLHQVCEKFGNIEGVKIFYDPLTRRHLGKARVGFSTSASAKLAVAKLDGTSIMGCVVHADFEHKVDLKPASKPQTAHPGPESARKTPPPFETTTSQHVLPTPPPSTSSQSPANSTPSTPGSLGLVDPRTRSHSTSSESTEKHRTNSPAWQSHPAQPPNQSTHRTPVFEPISPPCEKVTLPPPPPPDAPPPPLPGNCHTPSPPSGSLTKQSFYSSAGGKYQDSAKHGKDNKGSSIKTSREYYKDSHLDDDFEWRRRDRDRGRDRHDSYRSRLTADEKDNAYRDSRYSGYKEYSRRSSSESHDGKIATRKSCYRDNETRRSNRGSDVSYSSEKSERTWKSKYDHSSAVDDTDIDNSRTKHNLDEETRHKVKTSVEPHSLNKDGLKPQSGATLSSQKVTNFTCAKNADRICFDEDKIEVERSVKDTIKSGVRIEHVCVTLRRRSSSTGSSGDVDQRKSIGAVNMSTVENNARSPHTETVTQKGKKLDKSATGESKPNVKQEGGAAMLQEGDIGYYPMVEDISPVSSPTKASMTAYQPVAPHEPTVTSYDRYPVSSKDVVVEKRNQRTSEDNDDAMSLSSISSNEETLEVGKERVDVTEQTLDVTKPEMAPMAVPPPTIPFPPPFVPSVPPPFIPPFDPTVPPPSVTALPILPPAIPITVPPPPIQTVTPAHPLVPPTFHPTFPPQFVSTLAGVPTVPVQPQYQPYSSGYQAPSHEQRPPMKKKWKAKISEEVLSIISKELQVILKKDVNKRLVENSAFKALDGWWDNLGKTKAKTTSTQPEATPSSQAPLLSTTSNADMTSPLFSASMDQRGGLRIGLRATLPKMPSFRKRQQPSSNESELYGKRKREDSTSDSKPGQPGSDSEASVFNDGYQNKAQLNDDQLSPWQQGGDSIDGPPATSVRTEEKHPTGRSTLYSTTNLYSSLSESESVLSGDESRSDNSGDDHTDWEESDEDSEMSSDSASQYSSDEEDTRERDVQTSEMVTGVPRTPPGTPPETPPATPPVPRTPSITPPASPMDTQLETIEQTQEVEAVRDESLKVEDKEGYLGSKEVIQSEVKTVEYPGYLSEGDKLADKEDVSMVVSEDDNERQSKSEAAIDVIRNDFQELVSQKSESTNLELTELVTPNLSSTPSVANDVKSPEIESEREFVDVSVTKETPPEEVYQPVVELPPEFPVRPYWQDDQLVYDFLVSGLDYEDASYLKIGFENLVQVGSDSITDAHWSFHPTTFAGALTKGRKQKSDNCGVRVHSSGSARCEGYYKISMAEKAKYLEAARRQIDRTQAVHNKKAEEKEANKAKQQSRENRALQRRLAASFQNEDFGDVLKFNQLKVRKKKLTFCKSRIHDWGLFALEPIGPDEMVIEYVGEVIRQAIADEREKRYERLGIGSSYLFRVDSDTILDATKFGNLARFINHCCEPNCYAKVVTLESEKKIVIYSKRDIAVNEEITYDYKFPIEDDKIPCLCGAAQCRGTLN